MSYSHQIPTLNDFQVKNLDLSANNDVPAFLILEPIESDDQEIQAKLKGHMTDALALVEMGLTTDVTEEFKKQEQTIQDRYGRTFKAYALTEVAYLMFHNFGERVAN